MIIQYNHLWQNKEMENNSRCIYLSPFLWDRSIPSLISSSVEISCPAMMLSIYGRQSQIEVKSDKHCRTNKQMRKKTIRLYCTVSIPVVNMPFTALCVILWTLSHKNVIPWFILGAFITIFFPKKVTGQCNLGGRKDNNLHTNLITMSIHNAFFIHSKSSRVHLSHPIW